jgi:predicted nucleotidyltransferase
MIDPLEGNLESVAALCQEYGVLRLDVFGSVTTGTFDPEASDLDFVMTFEDRGLALQSATFALQRHLSNCSTGQWI